MKKKTKKKKRERKKKGHCRRRKGKEKRKGKDQTGGKVRGEVVREKYRIYTDFKNEGRDEESSRGEKKMRVGKSNY